MHKENQPIIPSLLWTDLYKLTMGNLVFKKYRDVGAKYEFIDRGKTKYPNGFAQKLRDQVEMMAGISMSPDEHQYLVTKYPYLSHNYVEWFNQYHFNPKEVKIDQAMSGELNIEIEGPWHRTIYWEVPLMTAISELYFKETEQLPQFDYLEKARVKAERMLEAKTLVAEFGTRRSYSTKVHRDVLEVFIEVAKRVQDGGVLLGTSNVKLAQEYDLTPRGTNAHEWIMFHGALFGVEHANEKAMEIWAKAYLGMEKGKAFYPDLGTALTDTYTTEAFLKTLNREWLEYFTFFRQDSGDPKEVAGKIIHRLNELGADLNKQGILFSDNLNTDKVIELNSYFRPITRVAFGVGTHITNDVGLKPLNMVIKAFSFTLPDGREIPVAKLSDDRGKESGDPLAVKRAKKAVGLL